MSLPYTDEDKWTPEAYELSDELNKALVPIFEKWIQRGAK